LSTDISSRLGLRRCLLAVLDLLLHVRCLFHFASCSFLLKCQKKIENQDRMGGQEDERKRGNEKRLGYQMGGAPKV